MNYQHAILLDKVMIDHFQYKRQKRYLKYKVLILNLNKCISFDFVIRFNIFEGFIIISKHRIFPFCLSLILNVMSSGARTGLSICFIKGGVQKLFPFFFIFPGFISISITVLINFCSKYNHLLHKNLQLHILRLSCLVFSLLHLFAYFLLLLLVCCNSILFFLLFPCQCLVY